MTRGEKRLRRAVRRRRPVAFWHLGREQLVVATLQPGEDEPLLLACAGVGAHWRASGSLLCPGLFEVARCGATGASMHAAAIEEPGCIAGEADVEVDCDGYTARFASSTIAEIAADFRAAGLRLATLHAEPWARAQLARFLGGACERRSSDRCLADDPLAAVTVAPGCEPQAAALGARLAVPIGLALAYFGMSTEP